MFTHCLVGADHSGQICSPSSDRIWTEEARFFRCDVVFDGVVRDASDLTPDLRGCWNSDIYLDSE